MSNKNDTCFDQQAFARFLDERSESGEETLILSHIASCQKCREQLEKLSGHPELLADIKEHLAEHELETLDSPAHDLQRQQKRDLTTAKNLLGPTDNPEMIGRLGNYEVCGVIGRGSAGIVVKALDTTLNRYVAIKMLAPAYSNNGCSRRRFEREFRSIASVENKNVVEIHTVEEFNGTPYIVMPYVPNGSLQHRIDKNGPLKTDEVVCLGMQIANGLAAAHDRGIVHRDMKPANVLLAKGIAGAMVSDFGLARVVDEATMTHSGTISGTPQYMSPEQAKGERVDQRSDLFSLGSTLYAACTGRPPFSSESVFGIIKKVCDSQPKAIREFNPDIPNWLVAFIDKLHSKQPENRFASAANVSALLEEELSHLQSPTLVAEPKRDWWEKKKNHSTGLLNGTLSTRGVFAIAGMLAMALIGGFVGSKYFGAESKAPAPMVAEFSSGNVAPGEMGNSSVVLRNQPAPRVPITQGTLEQIQRDQEKLPRFENKVEATIDVQKGGTLFLDSNLGTMDFRTHNKSTVVMKLVHSVAAENEEWANRQMAAVKLAYDPDEKNRKHEAYKKGRDAVITVRFPTRSRLSQEEIEKFDDIDDLKEQLLVRNKANFRMARFEILIPESFNVDLQTQAGAINLASLDGAVVARTHGGSIQTANVTGAVDLLSHGGNLTVGNAMSDVVLETHGGHIMTGSVKGKLTALSHGGRIEVEALGGPGKVESHGGRIQVWRSSAGLDARTHGGSIKVNFVEQPSQDSVLHTDAGSIEVGYVEGIALDIVSRNKVGGVTAPFLEKKATNATYSLNNGEVKLMTTTNVGSTKFRLVDAEEIDSQFKKQSRATALRVEGKAAFDKAYDLHMAGRIDEAIAAHQAAAKFEEYTGIATYNLGCAWALKGDADKAFKAFDKAIDHGFNDREQYVNDSDLDSLREDPRFDEMVKRIGNDPESEMVHLISRGNELLNEREYAHAEQHFKEALKFGITSAQTSLDLGMSLHLQGKLDEAMPFHKKAGESSDCGIAKLGLYNVACVHSLQGNTDDAFVYLEKAINTGFTDVSHMKGDSDLKNIRSDQRFEKMLELAEKLCDQCEDDESDCDNEEDDCGEK